ncbi:MAG TPA: NB-ARC domain-containing protein [Ktedonobacteraceae bacterium]|nr:NB-ARC domain-containing protein [Ktedonobacteraceae bacterium]
MQANRSWNQQLRAQREAHNWTIEKLAEQLGCSSKTVGRWEQNQAFPSPFLRSKLTALLEIDFSEGFRLHSDTDTSPLKEDWRDAPAPEQFYGREKEYITLSNWIEQEQCRVIAITGIGGIGKTAFANMAARKLSGSFERIWWRSLQNTPSLEELVTSCLHFLLSEQHHALPDSLDQKISHLIEALNNQRCLLILDNAESILQPNRSAGQYQPTHAGYGRFLRTLGELQHQSCLLLTSREKLQEIARLEGDSSPVRTLSLSGLETVQCRSILQDKQLYGSDDNWAVLAWLYRGNPLALKLAAEPIREVFQGSIEEFLNEKTSVFGDIHTLLEQHFTRLSALELELIYWLVIEREEVSIQTLHADILSQQTKGAVLEALDSLRRRSLLETGKAGHFILQPVILEDATNRFIESIAHELEQERVGLFGTHALLKAQANDSLRDAQTRFLLAPIAYQLIQRLGRREAENKMQRLLEQLRQLQRPDYAAGNLLNLLSFLQFDLRGYDFSSLFIKQAYLQDKQIPEINFAYATFDEGVFTQTFSNLQCVAVSPNGHMLATGTTTGEIWFWRLKDLTPSGMCQGHVDGLRTLTFSDDSRLLASGGEDGLIRIWETSTRTLRHCLTGHTGIVRTLAFSPASSLLASGSEDETLRIWDAEAGTCLTVLTGHSQRVRAVVFDNSGELLVSGSEDATIRCWEMRTGRVQRILQQDEAHVMALTFDPLRQVLISGHEDGQIHLWDIQTGQETTMLAGHGSRVRSLAIDSTGKFLASGSDDQSIRLWNLEDHQLLNVLHGHSNRIWSLAFTPDASALISVSEDETLRVWKTADGHCQHTLRGYVTLIKDLAFSPDGRFLVSGSEDQRVCLWDSQSGQSIKTFKGHSRRVRAVAYSRDGATVASGGEDESVRLWDVQTGKCLHVLRQHTHLVRAVAFSSDSLSLASAGYDQNIRLWDTQSGLCYKSWPAGQGIIWSLAFNFADASLASAGDDSTLRIWTSEGQLRSTLTGHEQRVWRVAFSPNGTRLTSSSDDCTARVWDSASGHCLHILRGHQHWVRAIAFSPNGEYIATGSHDKTIKLWDSKNGSCLHTFAGHQSWIWSIAFSPDGQTLASCGDDSTIRLWNLKHRRCTHVFHHAGPYEHMNITGVKGLSTAQIHSLKLLGATEE